MENASKALIIAGSIIISLVIVSLGILVYRRVSGTVTNANLDQQQIEAHNSDYEAYFGDYVSAANTKALLAKIKTNNTLYDANKDSTDELVKVYVKSDNTIAGTGKNIANVDSSDGVASMGTVIKEIKSSKHYRIQVDEVATAKDNISSDADTADGKAYYQNGYIKTINIVEATN